MPMEYEWKVQLIFSSTSKYRLLNFNYKICSFSLTSELIIYNFKQKKKIFFSRRVSSIYTKKMFDIYIFVIK